jgi:phosphohistidine phosphatase
MKKLIFVRHGRAEDPAREISDFERSLTLKGKVVSKLMAVNLKLKEYAPGRMITSPAFRALETAIIFAEEFGVKPEQIIMDSNLYYKMNIRYLSEILSNTDEKTDTITLFGHNPSFTDIAGGLSKEGSDFIPKSGVVCISFNINKWLEIKQNTGNIEYFLKPE